MLIQATRYFRWICFAGTFSKTKAKQTMKSIRYQERLTPDNAALLLIDHQVVLFTGVRDIPVAGLKHNVVALAKANKVMSVPINVTPYLRDLWSPVILDL